MSSARAQASAPGAARAPLVLIEGVRHVYGRGAAAANLPPAVEDLTLDVMDGEFVAVVGPSGCGKSTLMKLVTGLQAPVAGRVAVDGVPVTGPVRIAGMAFQAPTLLPWRTTLENLLLPLEIVPPHRQRLRAHRAEYVARAENLLRQVGLGGMGDKYPWQLSGGMQQRASLCRAMIHGPRLLMLDEPFGALDAFTREELWCLIRDLHAAQLGTERQMTVILVTHDLREATFLADRIFCMSARPGRIIAERHVDLPRPRDLEVTYTPEFAAIVLEMRKRIEEARGAPAPTLAPAPALAPAPNGSAA